jgi:hypothetical protein
MPSQSNLLEDFTNALQDAGKAIDDALTGNKKGPIESAAAMNSTVWRAVAANAWNYFQPGIGVDRTTGLPWSGNAYPYFTDWDLGVYIQATIDASKMGLIKKEGSWGFNDRINRVLTFCENRELNNYSYPYWFYQARDGGVYHENSDSPTYIADTADTGRLLVALNNLRTYDALYAESVNNLVYNAYGNRSNYAELVPDLQAESQISTSVYAYYAISGFASFWPTELSGATEKVLDNIYASGTVVVNDVPLPKASLTSDILFCLIFETAPNSRLNTLTSHVYTAHVNYNQATGKYRAFGEGSSVSSVWQWEWVTLPDGRKWTVLNGAGDEVTSSPMVYTKVALCFLSVYNTAYAKNMSSFIEHSLYSFTMGYGEGIDESKQPVYTLDVQTNGLILEAANYAIQTRP